MSRYLLASTPAQGHAGPLLAVARHLVGHGHEVVFLTTPHYRARVEETGARFVGLGAAGDRHDTLVANPAREGAANRGLRGVKDDMRRIFIDPAPSQAADLATILERFDADAVLVDTMFVGVAKLALGADARQRPAVALLGVLPLTVSSRDTAPFGLALAPRPGRSGRARNRALTWFAHRVVLADIQRYANRMLAGEGLAPLGHFVVDAPAYFADRYLQATVPEFEYPRSDMPAGVTFIGPILPARSEEWSVPPWWDDLRTARARVHVTQGTIDNFDLSRLVLPTISALATDDVVVVATTGGPDPDAVLAGARPLPANARLERFLPHDRLLDTIDVMVTNGGYGGVQQALAKGVPLVVAGDSEDKPEVAARVAWAGAGINLRSGRPAPAAIADAVRRVLASPTHRARA